MQSFFVSKKRVLEHDGHNVFFASFSNSLEKKVKNGQIFVQFQDFFFRYGVM